jgi:glycosyltransferase involved in cell wall biosynthesis
MRVLIVALFPVPTGGAAACRVRALAAGLSTAGAAVQVVGYLDRGHPDPGGGALTTVVHGVPYIRYQEPESTARQPRSTGWGWLRGSARTWEARRVLDHAAAFLRESSGPQAVMLYNQRPVEAWRLGNMSSAHRALFVQQYAEMQLQGDFERGWRDGHYLRQQCHIRLIPRRASLNLAISSWLVKRCAAAGGQRQLLVPALLDPDASRRIPVPRPAGGPPVLTYMGAGARRDLIPEIMRAVAVASKAMPTLRLRLVGLGKGAVRAAQAWAAEHGIVDRCEIHGWVEERSVLEGLLESSSAFILMRPDDQSSRACFPTRLPEYLSTGRPVVLSDVGDLRLHLRDSIDAFFSPPGDIAGTASAIVRCLADPATASAVGLRGWQAARREFCPDHHGRRVFAELEKLVSERTQSRLPRE